MGRRFTEQSRGEWWSNFAIKIGMPWTIVLMFLIGGGYWAHWRETEINLPESKAKIEREAKESAKQIEVQDGILKSQSAIQQALQQKGADVADLKLALAEVAKTVAANLQSAQRIETELIESRRQTDTLIRELSKNLKDMR